MYDRIQLHVMTVCKQNIGWYKLRLHLFKGISMFSCLATNSPTVRENLELGRSESTHNLINVQDSPIHTGSCSVKKLTIIIIIHFNMSANKMQTVTVMG